MIIEYDPQTGEITHVMNDPVFPTLAGQLQAEGATFLNFPPTEIDTGEIDEAGSRIINTQYASCDIATDYVSEGAIKKRPSFSLPAEHAMAVGDTLTVNDLPANCKVTLDGETTAIQGGELTIEAEMPAEYALTFTAWPCHPHQLKVIINAVDA